MHKGFEIFKSLVTAFILGFACCVLWQNTALEQANADLRSELEIAQADQKYIESSLDILENVRKSDMVEYNRQMRASQSQCLATINKALGRPKRRN